MNDLKKLFIIILRSLRPWRLCGRYSELLWLCGTRTLATVMNRINYQQRETLASSLG
jgi:hypothetical protein